MDDYDKAQASADQMFTKMDRDGDGLVSRTEQATTGVAIPAELSLDDSLDLMIKYLQDQGRACASLTAKHLSELDPGSEPTPSDPNKIQSA